MYASVLLLLSSYPVQLTSAKRVCIYIADTKSTPTLYLKVYDTVQRSH